MRDAARAAALFVSMLAVAPAPGTHAQTQQNQGAMRLGFHPWRPPFGLERVGAKHDSAEPLEFAAAARSDPRENPVDLGAILVPHGSLLVGPGSRVLVDIAACSPRIDRPAARILLFYLDDTASRITIDCALKAGQVVRKTIPIGRPRGSGTRASLVVALEDAHGQARLVREIPVMVVPVRPAHPTFGATYETLRYDPPISVRDPRTGQYSTLPYEGAWPAELRDVVVWLPGGGRFVFWRGSSYIPFWAGAGNTGACYEWAEIISQPRGAVDCVEPLMDKELRYSRVSILESTSARVRVRWQYQSTDLHYKVWGDLAVEDYEFYPDGFGTRAVTLRSDPANDYELCELILLTPAGAYPFEVLPESPVDAIFLDGRKLTHQFPRPDGQAPVQPASWASGAQAIFRLRLDRGGGASAILFSPRLTRGPKVIFGPFSDRGLTVTPCYWGSHWPLARGNSTGNAIDDRVGLTPCHNSVMSWANVRPEPLYELRATLMDTLGKMRPMLVRRWEWLIGMSAADDDRLRDLGRSFASPPRLEVHGAAVRDRAQEGGRALGLEGGGREVRIVLDPQPVCVNPVFEWNDAPRGAIALECNGRTLDPSTYAWDGRVLWLDQTFRSRTRLTVRFGERS